MTQIICHFCFYKKGKTYLLRLYETLSSKIHELQNLKKHALIDIKKINKSTLKYDETLALIIAKNIIFQYNKRVNRLVEEYEIKSEYITQLKLQKLLYYVQVICLQVFGKKAFSERILAWNYGPVVYEVIKNTKKIMQIN